VSIAYQVIGDGAVDLLFVRGWMSHVEHAWEAPALRRFLERLAEFTRLVIFDPRGSGQQAMVSVGVPEHIAQMNTQAFALLAQGDSDWVTDDVPTILGRPARSFEQFATDHAEAFS